MASKVTCSSCGWSWNKSDSSKKDLYICHQCGKDNTMKDGGWLNKFEDTPDAQNGIEGTMGGLTDQGFNYNGAWGGTMQMGGSLPGSVGFTYARTQSPAPSNGKYAKKTKASAQDGIQTFYNNYLQSPKYKERLMKEGFSNPNSVINQRLKNVSKSKIKSGSESYYDPTTFTAFINQKDAKTYNTPISSVIAHELSHAAGALGRTDDFNPGNLGLSNFAINQINKRNNLSGYVNDYIQGKAPLNIEKMHDSKPSEFKADMDMLRYRLFNDKIYDAGKQDFNQDVLNKAKQKYKGDKEVERLFKRAKDQDLIWLMNNIAQVNSTSDDQLPMAQNGQEMKYYQEGLDWKPKNISKDGGWLSKYEGGGIIEDDMGQWAHPGEITKINSNQITMQGVNYPVLGISDTGDTKMMKPGKDYKFKGKSVTELPMMQGGGDVIKVKQPDGSSKTYNTNSEEYRKLYDSGNLMNYDKSTDTYFAKPLDEVVITGQAPEKGFWEQYRDDLTRKHNSGILDAVLGTPIDAVFGLPQRAMMYGLTGKVQDPSEALNIKNPIGALATDVIADPLNLAGIGLADDVLKGGMNAERLMTKEQLLEKGSDFVNKAVLQPIDRAIVSPIQFRNERSILKNKFSNILDRYQSNPEAARRLTETLGIRPEELGAPKLAFRPGIGSKYIPKDNVLNIDFREARDLQKLGYDLSDEAILEHEWNHYLQKRAYELSPEYKDLVDEYYNNLDFYNSEKSKVGPLKFQIDNFFSNNPLKKPDYPNALSMPTSIDYDLLNAFGNPELIRENLTRRGADDLEYFLEGVPGRKGRRTMIEPMPHLGEMRQNMLERNVIQDRFQPITEENVYQFLANPNGDRISRFASHRNPETIKALTDALKNLSASIPVGVVASTQLPEEKNGGWLNKYE